MGLKAAFLSLSYQDRWPGCMSHVLPSEDCLVGVSSNSGILSPTRFDVRPTTASPSLRGGPEKVGQVDGEMFKMWGNQGTTG